MASKDSSLDSAGGPPLTRRRFLEMVGVVGGSAAVYETMVAMGLLRTPPAHAEPLPADPAAGQGRVVLVLGAGIGGLTAALRLLQRGFEPLVLEASADRIGGRNFTVHRDSVIHQEGMNDQVCKWDAAPELYWEAGCGRIPYHHYALLKLCRELNVRLEPYLMESRANRFQKQGFRGGAATVNRRIANDTRGYVSTLLAKAINQGSLDAEISPAEKADLLDLLPAFGKVDPKSFAYTGSPRLGYTVPQGVVTPGVVEDRIPRAELLASKFWKYRFYQPEDIEWQTSLLEPVGGMGKIVEALVQAVNSGKQRIFHGNVVNSISQTKDSITVRFKEGGGFAEGYACISTIPFPLLARLLDPASFSPKYRAAVATPKTADTCKIGWQAEQRFWEDPERDQIYGGISWIDHDITQFWYPSAGFFAPKGALTGTYNYGAVAQTFGDLSLDKRLDLAWQGALRLHPNFGDHVKKELGLSIAWQKVPYINGGWADWKDDQPHRDAYATLLNPEGKFSVCGDQLSYLPGWQEGAVLSAEHAVQNVIKPPTAMLKAAPIERAPSAASVTGAE